MNNDEAIDRFHKLNDHPPLSPPMSEVRKCAESCASHDGGGVVVWCGGVVCDVVKMALGFADKKNYYPNKSAQE